MQVPLTNSYGDRIGHIEIQDRLVDDLLKADTMPTLWLGYRIRGDQIEKFILRQIEE